MQLWKLGCRWGGGTPLFYDFIKENNIVIGWLDKDYQINDWLLITNGHTVLSLAEVCSDRTSILNFPQWEDEFNNLEIPFEKDLFIYQAKYLNLQEKDRFNYPLQQGIIKVKGDEYIATFKKLRTKYMNQENLTNSLSLLRYKKQIILQGPPGTGKTKLAKELAKALIVPSKKVNATDLIVHFLKEFDPSTPENSHEFSMRTDLLDKFHQSFPKEKLADLTRESYAIGTGANNSFCWWIERGLKHLGYYFPGSARSYLLYYKKELGDYSIHGRFLKKDLGSQEAMTHIAELINSLISYKEFDKVRLYFGDGFLLKLLHSYYPDEYFPVNSVPCLENILKLLKVDYLGMSALQMNLKIQTLFDSLKLEHNSKATNHDFMKFLFESFNIKGKVEIVKDDVVNEGEFKLVQFHPSYSYEDFVRGITIEIEDNLPNYIVKNKVLASFADLALNNPMSNYVLIIDEINMANLSAVLGELIYALEYRYDQETPSENIVESMYSLKMDDEEAENGHVLKLPQNLYIIGTMNTADRSVSHIDYAIRRRFAFVDVLPKDLSSELGEVFHKQLFEQVANLFVTNLSLEFEKKDVQLGHSYFIDRVNEGGSMPVRLQYEIKPILIEYVKDGILTGEDILHKISDLNV